MKVSRVDDSRWLIRADSNNCTVVQLSHDDISKFRDKTKAEQRAQLSQRKGRHACAQLLQHTITVWTVVLVTADRYAAVRWPCNKSLRKQFCEKFRPLRHTIALKSLIEKQMRLADSSVRQYGSVRATT